MPVVEVQRTVCPNREKLYQHLAADLQRVGVTAEMFDTALVRQSGSRKTKQFHLVVLRTPRAINLRAVREIGGLQDFFDRSL